MKFQPWHLVCILISPIFPPILLVVLASMIQTPQVEFPTRTQPMPQAWHDAIARNS